MSRSAAPTPTPPPEPSFFTTRQDSGVTVVDFQVDNLLGLADLNKLGPKLLALAGSGSGLKLVLDLSRIRYAGSAALGLLLKVDAELKEHAGKLALVANENMEGLFRVSRTRNLFTIAPDVPSAVRLVS
jgi:anti-anti-sigma factor